ncbi:MAG: prephenate dehydratase domain-containing protein [Evtepia gabavorous]
MALYGLERLAADIQDRSNNYTRFICISKSWRSIPARTRPPSWWCCPTGPVPCTRFWRGSMPWG